jgi:hypothetical protein
MVVVVVVILTYTWHREGCQEQAEQRRLENHGVRKVFTMGICSPEKYAAIYAIPPAASHTRATRLVPRDNVILSKPPTYTVNR